MSNYCRDRPQLGFLPRKEHLKVNLLFGTQLWWGGEARSEERSHETDRFSGAGPIAAAHGFLFSTTF